MLNMCQISSLMAAAEGPVAEFSSFANFEEKKRKSNLLMPFPKTGNQMSSFGQIRKKFVFPLLSADSRYFRIYALKSWFNLMEYFNMFREHLLRLQRGEKNFLPPEIFNSSPAATTVRFINFSENVSALLCWMYR